MVVACISDLFFQSKVIETARHLRVDLTLADSEAKLEECIQGDSASVFIVDLCFVTPEGIEVVSRIRGRHPDARLIAFAPHVEEGRLERARLAGASEVMSRSKFTKALPELLKSCS